MNEAEKCFLSLNDTFKELEESTLSADFIYKFLGFLEKEFPEVTVGEMIHLVVTIFINYIQQMELPTVEDEEDFAFLLVGSGYNALNAGRGKDIHFGPSPEDG